MRWGEIIALALKMSFVDIALMTVIIAGAVYLLYRSVWKKKGHCPGCDSETCKTKKKNLLL